MHGELFSQRGTSGTWGEIGKTKSSWIIYNQDYDLLDRLRCILEKEENMKFKISEYYDSARVYHLKPSSENGGSIKKISDMYRNTFYDDRCRKTIPEIILRSPFEIRQAFFMGYYAGDGNRNLDVGVVINNKGSLGSAQLFYLARSLGYKVSLNYKEGNIYRLQCSTWMKNKEPFEVKKIEDAPDVEEKRTIRKDIIRNGEKLMMINGVCKYKKIEIHCERMPRQKLLDSLDSIQEKLRNIGTVTKYVTKEKKLTFQCCTCGSTGERRLADAHNKENHVICKCDVKYVDMERKKYVKPERIEYVYDIETVSHHFAAGVGDLIVHNSCYGTYGAQNGPMPFVPGAASVTAMGRMLIMKAIEYILSKYSYAKLVYGDSVTPDTAILIRKNGSDPKTKSLNYVNIEDIPRKSPWLNYIGDKEVSFVEDGVEVWSDKGFTRIKKVIRHKTDKDIYRVLTHTGSVDVTKDHSLLRPDGEEVSPEDVNVGESLMHTDLPLPEPYVVRNSPAQKVPYSMGLFYGDGSCGVYDCPSGTKATWAINNTNLDYLGRAKAELESYYHFEFKILDTIKSSGVYKLCPVGIGIKGFVEEWREYFYSDRRQKKVPEDILNAPMEDVEKFMEGYYCADGDKNNPYRFDNKGQIGSAGLAFLCNRMGYNTSLNCRTDKLGGTCAAGLQLDIYRITCTKGKQRKDPTKIKKLWNMGPTEEYVYDLETDNHHFAAGVGKMVVHNTDSSMMTFIGKSTAESFEHGDKISKETSHFLKTYLLGIDENFEVLCPSDGKNYRIDKYPRDKIGELEDDLKVIIYSYDGNPVNLQFENLYKRYLLLTKKRYVAHAVNRKGEIINIIKKGVVLARRDNSQYLRDTYKALSDGILELKAEMEVMYTLYDRIHKLFTRQIPDANLIVYMGVKTVINYAKRKEKKQGKTVVERTFIDEDGQPIDDPIGPLDPRLIYPNLPQVLLALKMLKRGDDVPPNTRLEYLYIQNEEAEHQGEKAEDYTFYKENKDILGMKPDYLHYIEKQLTKPVMELLGVKYPRAKIPYEKIDDALERCISELDDLLRHRVESTKYYEKTVTEKYDPKIKIGWSVAYCRFCKKLSTSTSSVPAKKGSLTFPSSSKCQRCPKHRSKLTPKTYVYKNKAAKVQYIIDSMLRKRENPKAPNEIDEKKYPELLRVATKWKSRFILDKVYKQYELRKRPVKRPTQTGEKLRVKTNDGEVKVFLTEEIMYGSKKKGTFKIYPKHTLVTLKSIREEEDLENSTPKKKKKKYFYSAETDDGVLLENIPRSSITTWYYRDGSLMKDVLLARGSYMCVVDELNIYFKPDPVKKKEIRIFTIEDDEGISDEI